MDKKKLRSLFLNQKPFFFLSLAISVLILLSLFVTLALKSPPETKHRDERGPLVQTLQVSRGPYMVKATGYGEAKAAKTLNVVAPFSGTAELAGPYNEGSYISKGALLFTLNTEPLIRKKKSLESRVKDYETNSQRLEAQLSQKKQELAETQTLQETVVKEVANAQSRLDNALSLYNKAENLYQKGAVSKKALLEEHSRYQRAEAEWLASKKQSSQNDILIGKLQFQVSELQLQQKELAQSLLRTQLELKTTEEDLKKAYIRAPDNAQILKLKVNKLQEVTPGLQLATLRFFGEVEVSVSLPDFYFKWLYDGGLLEEPNKRAITINLVNAQYKKSFTGGFLKSAGAALDGKTRSLPLIIARENPLSADGFPIKSDELLPGMYCKVTIPLQKLEEVFLVPTNCIQRKNEIYLVDSENHLRILPAEILFQGEEGSVLQLPSSVSDITVVAHPLESAREGMPVRREQP